MELIVMTVGGTKSIVPQRNVAGIPILREEIVLIQKRALTAIRENGQGYATMTTFCRCMNISPPMMAQTTFHGLNSDLHNAYVQTAAPKNQ